MSKSNIFSRWARSLIPQFTHSPRKLRAAAGALAILLTAGSIGVFAAEDKTANRLSPALDFMPGAGQPGQGLLIEELDGSLIEQENASTLFNPASAVKLMTAYAALKQFGPDYQFHGQPLQRVLKDMLSRSDNSMAAALGRLVGGPKAIAKECRADFGLANDALSLATASGLGVNRVTPKAMIATLRGLTELLEGYGLVLSDVLPIAGVDRGTLLRRFANSSLKGVLIGKTGTLKRTDGGASVLVGQISTLDRGTILFVIFQRGKNTAQLRRSQNEMLDELLASCGGPGIIYGAQQWKALSDDIFHAD